MNKIANSTIVMLRRSQLHPHPDNPRKDLGDLEELKESIREHGIMQNLTVVPVDDNLEDFRILIGHRRFAASEGVLSELPCVIAAGQHPSTGYHDYPIGCPTNGNDAGCLK